MAIFSDRGSTPLISTKESNTNLLDKFRKIIKDGNFYKLPSFCLYISQYIVQEQKQAHGYLSL